MFLGHEPLLLFILNFIAVVSLFGPVMKAVFSSSALVLLYTGNSCQLVISICKSLAFDWHGINFVGFAIVMRIYTIQLKQMFSVASSDHGTYERFSNGGVVGFAWAFLTNEAI